MVRLANSCGKFEELKYQVKKVANQTLLISSILGIVAFSFIARYFYRYADGKANIQSADKKEKYLQWQATHGVKVKKAIKALSIIYGLSMLFQLLSLL